MYPSEPSADARHVRNLMTLPSSEERLKEAFSAAEESEEPDCQYLRALFTYTGVCTPPDPEAAADLFVKAASAGSIPAKIVSDEIDRDPEAAATVITKRLLAERGDAVAMRELFGLYDTGKNPDGTAATVKKNHAEAVRLYTPLAENGDADAQNTLGFMHLKGKGIPKDRDTAVRYLEAAADRGCMQAACRIAMMYDEGLCGTPADLGKAVEWYTKAADGGYVDAQFALSGILFLQDTEYFRPEDARRYLTMAADNGHPDGMHQLGLMYCYGANGFDSDPQKGAAYLEKACRAGVQQAMIDYANMRFEGQLIQEDMSVSAEWFSRAAEMGSGIAQYATGVMYAKGYHYDRDDEEAFRRFNDAAESGEPNAQYALACFCYEGRGTERDDSLAWSWFQQAAEQGHPSAMCFTAMFMISGRETEQDVKGGLKILKGLAKEGFGEAEYYLGMLYSRGEYVRKNRMYAKRMLSRAAEHGDRDAESLLEEINNKG